MGQSKRLVDIVILSFLLKSVNGQAIFDRETTREENFFNLATRVMDLKFGQLTQTMEEQLTQKLDAIEKMVMTKMDNMTENLTIFNQTNQAVSLRTNTMSKELNDMKKQIANLLKMEQLLTNTTLLYESKLSKNEGLLHDLRDMMHLLTNVTTDAQGKDCADILKKCPVTSGCDGVYNIRLACNKLKQVYCDMSTDNGGWTVIQRRMDGSVDFYRNWTEYRNGFGNAHSEYWIGNEILHKLTSARDYELRVDMQRFSGEKAYALYSNFSVGDENSKYQLTVQGYCGSAGDSLTYSDKMKFSTVDQDNDKFPFSCSTYRKSAGWFNRCAYANPNGQYTDSEKISLEYIYWYHWKNSSIALKKIQLMIRPRI